MIATYSNLKFTEGPYAAGISQIKVAPREWLLDGIEIDFTTGKVVREILLQNGFEFITLDLVPESYEFEEKPKSNRGGGFYEVKISGLLNDLTPEALAVLQTLRNHEVIAIVKDRKKRFKVVGDEAAALVLQFANKEDNGKQGGLQTVAIELNMDAEKVAPFYELP